MNITLFDLDNLQKVCDSTSRLISEIKKSYSSMTEERKLFVSRADYEESLRIKNQCPQDFYFFRCFDVFIQIVYHRNLKKYLIYVDNYYDVILNKFERLPQSKNSYIISEKFEDCFDVYQSLIISCISQREEILEKKKKEYGLF